MISDEIHYEPRLPLSREDEAILFGANVRYMTLAEFQAEYGASPKAEPICPSSPA